MRVRRERKGKVSKGKEGDGKEGVLRYFLPLVWECNMDEGRDMKGLCYFFTFLPFT